MITLYIDEGITNDFMSHALHDLQVLAGDDIKGTSSDVSKSELSCHFS